MQWKTAGLALLFGGAIAAAGAAPEQTPAKEKEALRFEMTLTRADGEGGTRGEAKTLATPIISTVDGSTATISVTGGEPSYSISLSPTLRNEEAGRKRTAEVAWNVRLSGKSLPGATTVTVTGAGRVPVGEESSLTEVSLRDGQSGKSALFQLRVKPVLNSTTPGSQP